MLQPGAATAALLRPDSRGPRSVSADAIAACPDRIDVRTPDEFAEDHVPGAINCPVLSNEERAHVGALHAQASPFEAKKVGAALVSRNIAAIIEGFRDRPREWAPLVYCWRGGQRSRSLVHVMNEIGWRAMQLEGGYRAWRRHVVAALAELPQRFTYRVICGLTGSGKSRLVAALAEAGAQALDLEALAKHRGSLLGDLPGDPQPSQKRFESLVFEALQRFDPARPVFVESESKRIGRLQVPDALLASMRASECVRVELERADRVALLLDEYRHFLDDPSLLAERLAPLVPLLGRETIGRWNALAAAGAFVPLVEELLDRHYDPLYARSIRTNFPAIDRALVVSLPGIEVTAYHAAARRLVEELEPCR